jgi:hypothetical protein
LKFALINNKRVVATPQAEAVCVYCSAKMISKCGSKNVWHWSHVKSDNCDPWWENETEWHKEWKNHFNPENQEIVHFEQGTGEKHIADVKTDNNMVIEFQNSPLSEQELYARENFYGDMFWVVNGEKFKERFHLGAKLPSPLATEMTDVQIYPMCNGDSFCVWYLSENPHYKDGDLVEMHGGHKIEGLVDRSFDGHYLFSWKNKRSVWFKATKPVFIDFGEECLFRLKYFGNQKLTCVRAVSKKIMVTKNGGNYPPVNPE